MPSCRPLWVICGHKAKPSVTSALGRQADIPDPLSISLFRRVDLFQAWSHQQSNSTQLNSPDTVCLAVTAAASKKTLAHPGRAADRPRLTSAEGSRQGEVALLSFQANAPEAEGVAALVEGLVQREGLSAALSQAQAHGIQNRSLGNAPSSPKGS